MTGNIRNSTTNRRNTRRKTAQAPTVIPFRPTAQPTAQPMPVTANRDHPRFGAFLDLLFEMIAAQDGHGDENGHDE